MQTNGVWLGLSFKNTKAFIEKIIEVLNKNKSCRIAIEVSLKGANANDTAIYAGVKNVQGNPILNLQCCAFKYLRNLLKKLWDEGFTNIAMYPIAGLGPEMEDPWVIPLSSRSSIEETPIFHPQIWSTEFKQVFDDFLTLLNKYNEIYKEYMKTHGRRMHMYTLEARRWQRAWILRIHEDKLMEELARKYLRINIKSKNFKMFQKLFPQTLMSNIIADENIILKCEELREKFIEVDTYRHYTSL